jgi:hypothetical protein
MALLYLVLRTRCAPVAACSPRGGPSGICLCHGGQQPAALLLKLWTPSPVAPFGLIQQSLPIWQPLGKESLSNPVRAVSRSAPATTPFAWASPPCVTAWSMARSGSWRVPAPTCSRRRALPLQSGTQGRAVREPGRRVQPRPGRPALHDQQARRPPDGQAAPARFGKAAAARPLGHGAGPVGQAARALVEALVQRRPLDTAVLIHR